MIEDGQIEKVKRVIDDLFHNYTENYRIENSDSTESPILEHSEGSEGNPRSEGSEYDIGLLYQIKKQKKDILELYILICNSYNTPIKLAKKIILIGNYNHGYDIFEYLLILKIIFFKMKEFNILNHICLFCEHIPEYLTHQRGKPTYPIPIPSNNIISLSTIMENECKFFITDDKKLNNSVKEMNIYWSNIITHVINNDKDTNNHSIYIVCIGRSHILYNRQPNGVIVEPIQNMCDYLFQKSVIFTLDQYSNKFFRGKTDDQTTNIMIERNRLFRFNNLTKIDNSVLEYFLENYRKIVNKKNNKTHYNYSKILNKTLICNITKPVRLEVDFRKSNRTRTRKNSRTRKNKTKRRQFNEDIQDITYDTYIHS